MPTSQNCRFQGVLEEAKPDGPPGEELAARLCEALRAHGWAVTEPELWRDSGWQISASREGIEVNATLASNDGGQSFLQIAPRYSPGVIERWLKKRPSATADSVLAVSRVASAFLKQAGFLHQRWQWDSYPSDAASSTPSGEVAG